MTVRSSLPVLLGSGIGKSGFQVREGNGFKEADEIFIVVEHPQPAGLLHLFGQEQLQGGRVSRRGLDRTAQSQGCFVGADLLNESTGRRQVVRPDQTPQESFVRPIRFGILLTRDFPVVAKPRRRGDVLCFEKPQLRPPVLEA